jgi:hypothetical protein
LPKCLTAPAGFSIVLVLHDNLSGLPVNISVYGPRAGEPAALPGYRWFDGRSVSAPQIVVYRIGSLAPGSYVIQSDSYPALMQSVLMVVRATSAAHHELPAREKGHTPSPVSRG